MNEENTPFLVRHELVIRYTRLLTLMCKMTHITNEQVWNQSLLYNLNKNSLINKLITEIT